MSTERIARLQALADHGATDGERDTARRMLNRALAEANPVELSPLQFLLGAMENKRRETGGAGS
ncbi:hypothetical protein [Nocardia salmonicida]|uniref:hypothetical protein n=1 Tax=Nocardia salmonicida TaxID=53431 RepID=UPI0007A53E4D|nr:hypothetical protein [Nocardia salmonicida]